MAPWVGVLSRKDNVKACLYVLWISSLTLQGPVKHLHKMVLSLCPTNLLQLLTSKFGAVSVVCGSLSGNVVTCVLTVVLSLS